MRTCWIERRRTSPAGRVAPVPTGGGVATALDGRRGPYTADIRYVDDPPWQSRLADLEGPLRTRRRARTS